MTGFEWVVGSIAERDVIVVSQLQIGQQCRVLAGPGSIFTAVGAGSGELVWSSADAGELVTNTIFVRDYGSGFDGEADDTAAVQAAVAALQAAGSGKLVFPTRTRLRSPITILGNEGPFDTFGDGFEILGEGDAVSVIIWDPSEGNEGEDAITLSGYLGGGEDQWSGGGVRNILITTPDDTVAAACTGAGLRLKAVWNGTFANVWVRKFAGSGGTGWHISDESLNLVFTACAGNECDIGWHVNDSNQSYYSGCKADGNYSKGVYLEACIALTMDTCLLQGSTVYPLHIAPASDGLVESVQFINTYVETGEDTESIVRHDTHSSIGFVWNGGHMTSINTEVNYFDFETAPIAFRVESPRMGYSGTQKLFTSAVPVIGYVSLGRSEMDQGSRFALDADSSVEWHCLGIGTTCGAAPTVPDYYALDAGAYRGLIGLPRYTTVQRLAIPAASIKYGTPVYDTDLDAVFIWLKDGNTPPAGAWKEITVS